MMRPFDRGENKVTWRCRDCGFRMTADTDEQTLASIAAGRNITFTLYRSDRSEVTRTLTPERVLRGR